MSDVIKKKKTWAAYTCSVCRFVFRVPKEHSGKGVICPACRHLLKFPSVKKNDELPRRTSRKSDPLSSMSKPISKPLEKKQPIASRRISQVSVLPKEKKFELGAGVSSAIEAPQYVRRKSHRKHGGQAVPSWEQKTTSDHSGKGNFWVWLLGGGVLSIVIVASVVTLMMQNKKGSHASKTANLARGEKNGVVKLNEDEVKREKKIDESLLTSRTALKDSKKVIEAFFNAKTSEELEWLVRTPEKTRPRMKEWYAKHPWESPGLRSIAEILNRVQGRFAYIEVKLNDFTTREIVVERTDHGYLIDWESWVGWGEMEWNDIFKKHPTEKTLVRVECLVDSYYNRYFNDDKKWLVLRLTHFDEGRVLYGYIDKNSPMVDKLLLDISEARGRRKKAVFKIRYPKVSSDMTSDNQVIIEDYVQKGWVEYDNEKK